MLGHHEAARFSYSQEDLVSFFVRAATEHRKLLLFGVVSLLLLSPSAGCVVLGARLAFARHLPAQLRLILAVKSPQNRRQARTTGKHQYSAALSGEF